MRTRSRSLRGSFADLKVHTNGESTQKQYGEKLSPVNNSGIHFRHGHRDRKSTLNDDVPVERIGDLDRDEPFKYATEDLNREHDEKTLLQNNSSEKTKDK